MINSSAVQDLPRKRTGRLLTWLENHSISWIVTMGTAIYFLVVVSVSIVEFAFHFACRDLVLNGNGVGVHGLFDLLYFNFITILTVGYGDLHPVSYGKLFSVMEAFVGVGLFSMLVAVITVKALLPPSNAIVFSKYAYYCTEPQRFLIIFINTSNTNLGNAEISSYFKLGGDWEVQPSVTSPFITQSAQTFFVDRMPVERLVAILSEGDCLRIGITGGLGFTSFSTSLQYDADEILVIPDRDELISYEGFRGPDFTSTSFAKMFHYRPEGAVTLEAYVKAARTSKDLD